MTDGFRVPPGPSILEMLWARMDEQLEELLRANQVRYDRSEDGLNNYDIEAATATGHCLGIAECIAIMTNPYDPDVDAVRAEAMRRRG